MSLSTGKLESLSFKKETPKEENSKKKFDLAILRKELLRKEGIEKLLELFVEVDGFDDVYYDFEKKSIKITCNGREYTIGYIDFIEEKGEILLKDNYENTISSIEDFFNEQVEGIKKKDSELNSKTKKPSDGKEIIASNNENLYFIINNINENLHYLEKVTLLISELRKNKKVIPDGEEYSRLTKDLLASLNLLYDDIEILIATVQKFKKEKVHEKWYDYLDVKIKSSYDAYEYYINEFSKFGIIEREGQ